MWCGQVPDYDRDIAELAHEDPNWKRASKCMAKVNLELGESDADIDEFLDSD